MATSPSVCRGVGTYGAPKAPFWTTILNQISRLVSSDARRVMRGGPFLLAL